MPARLHLVIVAGALATGPGYLGSKPRFLLPAMLLGLPLARLLAPARTWVLTPLIAALAAASTGVSLYLMSVDGHPGHDNGQASPWDTRRIPATLVAVSST